METDIIGQRVSFANPFPLAGLDGVWPHAGFGEIAGTRR